MVLQKKTAKYGVSSEESVRVDLIMHLHFKLHHQKMELKKWLKCQRTITDEGAAILYQPGDEAQFLPARYDLSRSRGNLKNRWFCQKRSLRIKNFIKSPYGNYTTGVHEAQGEVKGCNLNKLYPKFFTCLCILLYSSLDISLFDHAT